MLSISTNTITQTIITIDITVNSSQAQFLIRRENDFKFIEFSRTVLGFDTKIQLFYNARLLWAPSSNLSMFQIFQQKNIVLL